MFDPNSYYNFILQLNGADLDSKTKNHWGMISSFAAPLLAQGISKIGQEINFNRTIPEVKFNTPALNPDLKFSNLSHQTMQDNLYKPDFEIKPETQANTTPSFADSLKTAGAGAVGGIAANIGVSALGNALGANNSKIGLLATGVASQIAGLVGSTVAENLISGSNAFSGIGNSLTSAASLAQGGMALGNIALDVFDPVKKSKGENIFNMGLGTVGLTAGLIGAGPVGWAAGAGLLAANVIGHAFGEKTRSFTANRDLLAQTNGHYGDSVSDILEAESLAGVKHSLWDNGGRHADDRKIGEAQRQSDILDLIISYNNDRRNIAQSNSAIYSVGRMFDMSGGYDQRYTAFGRNGMVLAKRVASKYKMQQKRKSFKNGGSILNEIKLFLDGGILNEVMDGILDYARNRFPILRSVPDINLQYDPEFKPPTNANIEYMTSNHNTLPYYNDYSKTKENLNKSTIVYNDNVSNEDIALDWLSHGLREYDSNYVNFLNKLSETKPFRNVLNDELFGIFSNLTPEKYRNLSLEEKSNLGAEYDNWTAPEKVYNSVVDGIIRGTLAENKETYKDNYDEIIQTPEYKNLYNYIFNLTDKYAEGGKFNVIPEGALHARLHHMENDENITKKGIPVVSEDENGKIEQQAEIERNEIILRLEVTKKLEELAASNLKEKAAIEAGKLLVLEILNNTQDNTGLINEIN